MEKSTNRSSTINEAGPPSQPPGYAEATAPSSLASTTHTFVRSSRLRSKVLVQKDGVARYCFTASKDSRVWIHAGTSTDNPPLGFLTFPETHNAFRIHFGEEGSGFSDARARIGYPHPKTFTFKSVKIVSDRAREFVWTHREGSLQDGPPVRYVLTADNGGIEEVVAVLTAEKKGREGTALRWVKEPGSEVEQAFLVASAIGVLTRMSKKGKFKEDTGTGRQRWFGFWWMAALSTIAIS